MEKYFVIENKNVGLKGRTVEMLETVLFAGTKEECYAFADEQRKKYSDRIVADCFVQSEAERSRIEEVDNFWNSLTDEQKKETIIVNGKKYNKALHEFNMARNK